MILTLDLPDDVIRRLTAEAERRGTHLAEVVTDLAAQLPSAETPSRRRLAFIGAGASRIGITDTDVSTTRVEGGGVRIGG